MPAKRRRRTSTFGTVRKLSSGRWQARYTGPDGVLQRPAPVTFDTKHAADLWLADKRLEIEGGRWIKP
jgi:hypothetical protein